MKLKVRTKEKHKIQVLFKERIRSNSIYADLTRHQIGYISDNVK
jgi:hypothetical protein